jgi:hypothetical protein
MKIGGFGFFDLARAGAQFLSRTRNPCERPIDHLPPPLAPIIPFRSPMRRTTKRAAGSD